MILQKRTPFQIKSIHNDIDSESDSLSRRRYSNLEFPSYRHIPGLTPHPISHENGHSFGKKQSKIEELTEKNWSTNEPYLFAIDLFNYAYYWEAHEQLEEFWKVSNNMQEKKFIQGLIQLSAAYLKWIQGFEEGFQKLSSKGLQKTIDANKYFSNHFGINLITFIEANKKFLNSREQEKYFPPLIYLML